MNIILVDDNQAFRERLKLYLEEHLNYSVVGETNSGLSFLEMNNIYADIILMDINMPGMGGLEAAKRSLWKYENLKIIAVSQYTDSVDLQQLVEIGFKGFVSKTNLFRDLEPAIRTILEGGYFFPEELKFTTN